MKIIVESSRFICKTKGVYLKKVDEKDDTGEIIEVYLCRAIYIRQRIRMLDTKDVYLVISFYCNDGWHEEIVPRADLTERNITTLIRKGADVGGTKTKLVVDYLFDTERNAPTIFRFKYLGWQLVNNKWVYAHSQLLLDESGKTFQYDGSYNVFRKGSYSKWHSVLMKHLAGNVELQLALCMGYSSVVIGYINKILDMHADSLIFHICGNSTTGKTTAAIVAVSGFGDPKEGAKSLIQSFFGTDNALIGIVSNNFGVPMVFDETSISQMSMQRLVNWLYTMSKNSGKARLNKTSELRQKEEWATSVITTGESTFTDNINQNEGIRARLFELRNIQWTENAQQSEELIRVLSNNYGHGVELFVKAIESITPSKFDSFWQSETQSIMKLMPSSKFSHRIGKKFAIITMTAKILNHAFQFNLDVEKITALLIAQELESLEERDIGKKVQEDLIEWLTINQSKFYIKKKNELIKEIWGRIDIKDGKTTAHILPKKFLSFLNSYSYSDRLVVLRELNNLEMIAGEKGKYVTRKVVKGLAGSKNGVQVYSIKFNRLFLGALEDENLSEPRSRPVQNEAVASMLDEDGI